MAQVFSDFESQGLEVSDAILQGASMHAAGFALLWSRVLAILRTEKKDGKTMQKVISS